MCDSDVFSQPCSGPASSIDTCVVLSPRVASGDEAPSNPQRDPLSHVVLASLAAQPGTERNDASGQKASSSDAVPSITRSEKTWSYRHSKQADGWSTASQARAQPSGTHQYTPSTSVPRWSYDRHLPANLVGDAGAGEHLPEAAVSAGSTAARFEAMTPGTSAARSTMTLAGAPDGKAGTWAHEQHVGGRGSSSSRAHPQSGDPATHGGTESTHIDHTAADTAWPTSSRIALAEPLRVELGVRDTIEPSMLSIVPARLRTKVVTSTGSPSRECVRLRDELRILNDAYAKQTEALFKEQSRSALLRHQCETLQMDATELRKKLQRMERHYERTNAQVNNDEEDRKVMEDAEKELTFDDLDCEEARAELNAILLALDGQDISPDAAIMRVFKSSNATLLSILQAMRREVKRAECRFGELHDDNAELRFELELEKRKNQGISEELAYRRVKTSKGGGDMPGAVLFRGKPNMHFLLRRGVAPKLETFQRPVKIHRYGKNSTNF
eukprot:GEMP01029844.1.p1 GENE.GEMP01029844.1~~GEMP01029844.1.p1  ORF type:complete len:499 (+),score=122.80 GEMP01029844.1:292-1788(+)